MALDFKQVDIEDFLFASLPIRFQDTEPADFENFISHLFSTNGYTLIQTSYSADFGAHIIVFRDGVKTAVQIRRYHEAHKVGTTDVRQIIGAQEYYNCQQAMVVTTSSYQPSAREMARQHEVILWSWQRLSKAITDTFLEGLDYYEYFENYATSVESTKYRLTFNLLKIEFKEREGEGEQPGTIVQAQITNETDETIRVHCDLPVYITRARKQYAALGWTEDSFISGEIHPRSTVELGFYFAGRQLSKYHKKDRLILSMHIMPQGEKVMLQQKLKHLKKTCYLVTFC